MSLILQDTRWIGKQRYHFEEIDSTNKKAKELIYLNDIHGILVTADSQTAGVGRRGRSWSSEKKTGIYMSLLLKPDIQADRASMLTLVAALAVNASINELLQINHSEKQAQIKWPNDIVINGKKICGILTEMTLNGSRIEAVIIGIGINVSNTVFHEEIAATASSLYLETGVLYEQELLIQDIWKKFEEYYAQFIETGNLCLLKEEYESYLVNKNEKVKVLDPKGEYTGVAKGITNTGELLVDTETGLETVSGGEVSVRGIYGYV